MFFVCFCFFIFLFFINSGTMVFGTIERKNYPRDWVMKAEDLWFMFGGKGGVISDTGIYDTGTNFLSKALDHMA